MTNKLLDITPEQFKCSPTQPCCPSVFVSRCEPLCPSCPSIEIEGNKCVIIGKIVTPEDYEGLKGRIGPDECAVEIPAELMHDLVKVIQETSND